MKSNIALNSNVSLEERTNHCFDALIAESFVRSKSRKCQRLDSPIRQILSAICNCLPHPGVEACTPPDSRAAKFVPSKQRKSAGIKEIGIESY
jgi:hypothetical protein